MDDVNLTYSFNQGPRENSEDDFGAVMLTLPMINEHKMTVAVVADGVGGNNYGEIASKSAVKDIKAYLAAVFSDPFIQSEPVDMVSKNIRSLLIESFKSANNRILRQIKETPSLKGMSTTLVCALIFNNTLYVAWAGDSRCYLYRRETLRQLTADHSEIQRLIDAGLINSKDAKSHPLAHTIYSYIGIKDGLVVGTGTYPLFTGDVVIICTDGLTDVVLDETITDYVWQYKKGKFSFNNLPAFLVKQALAQQTMDNVTVVCLEYQSDLQHKPELFDVMPMSLYPTKMAKTMKYFNKEFSNG